MEKKITVEVTSPPDREDLVAELWQGDTMWGELRRETEGELILELYPNPQGKAWSLCFEEAVESLHGAKEVLVRMGVIPNDSIDPEEPQGGDSPEQ